MYELVVIACLMAQPARCEEFHLPLQQPMGAAQCMHQAQLHLVRWVQAWPAWTVRRWRCGLPRA